MGYVPWGIGYLWEADRGWEGGRAGCVRVHKLTPSPRGSDRLYFPVRTEDTRGRYQIDGTEAEADDRFQYPYGQLV